MRCAPAIAIIVLVALAIVPADAQRRRRWHEPIPSWSIEPIMRSAIMKDDPVLFAAGRFARQMDSTLNLGIGVAMLISESAETQRADGFERVTSLYYLGPSIELRDSLRGPARFIVRATVVLGSVGFEEAHAGDTSVGTAYVVGGEPEIGILIRLTRFLQLSMTAGVLYGWRFDGGPVVVSGPSMAFGARFVY